MGSDQNISSPKRGRPRKVAIDAQVNGEVPVVSDSNAGDGQVSVNAVGVQAERTAKSQGRDLAGLNLDLARVENDLPSGVSIVRVWNTAGLDMWHGVRSSAPCEIGEDAYQVNTGQIYKF